MPEVDPPGQTQASQALQANQSVSPPPIVEHTIAPQASDEVHAAPFSPAPFSPIRRDGLRDATELQPRPSSQAAQDDAGAHSRRDSAQTRDSAKRAGALPGVKRFWARQVCIGVSHTDCRDHFANERTFLAYLRTSSALAMAGVLVAQLLRLQDRLSPANGGQGKNDAGKDTFFELALPIAGTCIGCAIVIAFAGACRFWRQQNAMARGKCHAGGWEVYAVGAFTFAILALVFVAALTVTVDD